MDIVSFMVQKSPNYRQLHVRAEVTLLAFFTVLLSQMLQFSARQDDQLPHSYVRLLVLIHVQTVFHTTIISASKGNWGKMIVKVPKQMKEINNTAKPMKCSDLK